MRFSYKAFSGIESTKSDGSCNETRSRRILEDKKKSRKGRRFNKLPHFGCDKHRVSSVSRFHCEAHVVGYFMGWGGQKFVCTLSRILFSTESRHFQTAKMQNSLEEQQCPDQSTHKRVKENPDKTGMEKRQRRFRQTSGSLIQSTRRRKYFTFQFHLTHSSKEPKAIARD